MMKLGKPIVLDDLTVRLRRNLVITCSLLMFVALSGVSISDKVALLGIGLVGLSTNHVIMLFVVMALYNYFSFIIRAYEAYGYWLLSFNSETHLTWSGKDKDTSLMERYHEAAKVIDKVYESSGQYEHALQGVSKDDVEKMMDVSNYAHSYIQNLKLFPKVTRTRFWLLDVGIPTGMILFTSVSLYGYYLEFRLFN